MFMVVFLCPSTSCVVLRLQLLEHVDFRGGTRAGQQPYDWEASDGGNYMKLF